jgi:RNA polymerase-binding transcription factor DksA
MTYRQPPVALATSGTGEAPPAGGRSAHAWRTVLESRWGERLISVITLSLAYHDTADQPPGDEVSGRRHAREVNHLMRKTVAARRALSDTEDALARLSSGTFGRCEQCAAAIPPDYLVQVPETRYCPPCARGRFTGLRHPPRTASGREHG